MGWEKIIVGYSDCLSNRSDAIAEIFVMNDWYRIDDGEQVKENLAINPKRLASGYDPDALTLKGMREWHPSFTFLLLQQLFGARL